MPALFRFDGPNPHARKYCLLAITPAQRFLSLHLLAIESARNLPGGESMTNSSDKDSEDGGGIGRLFHNPDSFVVYRSGSFAKADRTQTGNYFFLRKILLRAQIVTLGMFLSLPTGAVTGSRQEAAAEIQKGNYAIAYHLWRLQADQGDADACYSLGWMYHNGYGLVINDREAENYWQRAAAQGHSDAMFALGNLYSLGGKNVSQDYVRAVRMWAQSAEMGHQDASRALLQLAAREDSELDAVFAELLSRNPRLFDTTGRISANRVNLRHGPGKEHDVIEVLEHDKPVIEILRRGDWVKVGVANPAQLGWVYGKLIRNME